MHQIIILLTRNSEGVACEYRLAVAPYDSERYPIDALIRSEIFTDFEEAQKAAEALNRGIGPFDPGTEYPVVYALELRCTFGALVLGDYIARVQQPHDQLAESFTLESTAWSNEEIEVIHDWVEQVGNEFRSGQRDGQPKNFRFARKHVRTETAAFNADRNRSDVHTEDVALIVEYPGGTGEITAGFDWVESA